MRIEYEYTLNDLREGIWWRRRLRAALILLAWLVLLDSAAIALWLQQSHQATINVERDWASIVPWVAIPIAVVLLRLYHFRQQALQAWTKNPAFHLPHSIEIDEQGVRMTSSLVDTRYSWNYLVGWTESPNLLLLLLPGEMRLIIPKRAFGGDAELLQIRALIDGHVQKPTHGFPLRPAQST